MFVLIRPLVSFESIICVSIFQQRFDKFILVKITNRCHILKLTCTKFDFDWSSAPDHAGELTALPRLTIAGFKWPASNGRGGAKGRGRREVEWVEFNAPPDTIGEKGREEEGHEPPY